MVTTADDAAAAGVIRDGLGAPASCDELGVTVLAADGAQFVPRLFGLGIEVHSVTVSRPTLDDVFLAYTGNRMRERER